MKEKYIKILNMYFVDGEIPSDIAKTLKVSKSTVTRVLQKDERYSLIKKERTEFREKEHIEKQSGASQQRGYHERHTLDVR